MKTATITKNSKKSTRNRKGEKYACSVCGLAVTVDTDCGCVDACELVCCGKAMKPKKK